MKRTRLIRFERSGGLAGRQARLSLDLEDLPAAQAGEITRLLNESDFFNLPAKSSGPPAPDEFHYKITVDFADRSHSVEVSDTTAPEKLRPLLNELSMRARSRRA